MSSYTKRGKYWYKDSDIKHPLVEHNCIVCGNKHYARRDKPGLYCSKQCMQSGSHNTVWKGEEAGYMAKHGRVYRALGKADHCVFGCESTRYEWANLNADNDKMGEWGFAQMCSGCHKSYDHAIAKCFDKTCRRGHVLNDETMYIRMRDGREVRQCKQCAKDRAKEARQ